MCALFTFKSYFHPSASSTSSVRADASCYRKTSAVVTNRETNTTWGLATSSTSGVRARCLMLSEDKLFGHKPRDQYNMGTCDIQHLRCPCKMPHAFGRQALWSQTARLVQHGDLRHPAPPVSVQDASCFRKTSSVVTNYETNTRWGMVHAMSNVLNTKVEQTQDSTRQLAQTTRRGVKGIKIRTPWVYLYTSGSVPGPYLCVRSGT